MARQSGEDQIRRTNITNPNVFSDDYALETIESGNTTPESTEYPSINLSNPHSEHIDTINRSSKRNPQNHVIPRRNISTQSDNGTQRTFSTSTRFSIPRSQSPYIGPTAPSQPYAMYPQIIRSSSITTQSTIRQSERNVGPTHPYSMYPQNTSEEDTSSIPIGFPGQNYQSRTRSDNDIGDIIGSDGHIEQLPPYTRYPDNVVIKENIPESNVIDEAMPIDVDSSNQDTTQSEMTLDSSRKEGWLKRNKSKKICGLPIMIILVVAIILIAAAIGGVIGGLVGNEKGTNRVLGSSTSTTTVWLDADPISNGPSSTPIPTGHYAVHLQQNQQVNSCIENRPYAEAWNCMDAAAIGVTISSTDQCLSVTFDDYSNTPQMFRYGPQPPDFNHTAFELQPFKDKNNNQLGVAMFFSVLFDKIVILPENAISESSSEKRDISNIIARGDSWDYDHLAIGDQPWYCFWNSSINEFWIFVDQDLTNPSNSITTPTTPTTTSQTTTNTDSTITTPPYLPSSSFNHYPPSESFLTWSVNNEKRNPIPLPNYPKLIKMVEKRKPNNNTQPYCQKMQVLNNWQIMPIPNIPPICIEEIDSNTTSNTKDWTDHFVEHDITTQLDSKCVCEWLST